MYEIENVLGIVVTDREGIIRSVSHNNGDLNSSLIGTRWYDAFSVPAEEYHGVEKEKPKIFRLCESGRKISVSSSYDENGDVSGLHILVEKDYGGKSYTQFLNKVSCLGEIVPGIAHEINNPLSYVSGWLQMFLVEANDTDPKKKTYETLIKEFERIATLTNSLLEFTKQTPGSKKIFYINQVIEDIVTMIGYTMKNENIEIIKNMLPSKIETYGDSNRLKQVFLNVMQNAREAMPNGGAIYLSTNLVHDNSVLIQFRDTGCGISNDKLDKIFCQSYTTKAEGKCAGLGLSVCKTIIEELGGSIDIDSKVGVGTVVSLLLPKCSAIQEEHSLNVNQP
ncbi:MAG: two-component system sensor histidine kinase NtrB [Candidatus Scalindua sp.]